MRECPHPDARILVVDDEESNLRMLSRILHTAGYRVILTTTDGAEVVPLYRAHDPDLVLLDLHMPSMDGVAVLRDLRMAAAPQTYLPVLVLTGDPSAEACRRALAAGATDFVPKPFELVEVLLRIRNLLETRYLHQEIRSHNQQLETRVAERTAELQASHLDTLERLAIAAEFRDDDTGQHTERVGAIAGLLGVALGLSEEEVFFIRRAAPLHDVGKIGISDAILRKRGPLSEEEWETMKEHTRIGARILSGGRSRVVRLAEEIALSHHEHWNGLGYPDGLAGEAIPLAGRLVMVADVYDALSSDRVYRPAWPMDQVLAYIREHAGRRFDPRIASLCEKPDLCQALIAISGRRFRNASPRTPEGSTC